MRKLVIAVIVAAALSLVLPAYAGYISLNAPFVEGPTFTPQPGSTVEITTAGWGGTVAGYQYVLGTCCLVEGATASFGATDFVGQLTSNFNYTASGADSLSFSANISGPGNTVIIDKLTAAITWNSFYFPNDGSHQAANLFGTGIVTSSSGDAAFEMDFPLGGTFDITADLLCGSHLAALCHPDQPQGTELINGAITPAGVAAVPAPLIGEWPMLLCLAILGLVRRYRSAVNRFCSRRGRFA
jgi:hypothetical protein